MRHLTVALFGGVAIGALALVSDVRAAEVQPSTPASAPAALEEVVVTARRTRENLQSVPVAVSVVRQSQIDARGVYTPVDLAVSTPGLSVAAAVSDRNNLTFTIRGEGYEFGTLFPAVIPYFSEVPITQFGAGQFFDIGDIQILRGPQGVLFGRVTDGGNIMVTPQHPTKAFEGYVEAKVGDYGLRDFVGAVNLPLAQDKLLARVAFDINRRDGFTRNIATGQDLDNVAYESFRLGLTWRPTEAFENYAVVAYQHTHDNGTSTVLSAINPVALNHSAAGLLPLFTGVYGIDAQGNVLPFSPGLTPLTTASYITSLQNRLAVQKGLGARHVDYISANYSKRKNLYVADTATYEFSDDLQLKNVFGYTNVQEDQASNYGGGNGNAFLTCHSACGDGSTLPYNAQKQFSEELRLAGKSFDRKLSWSVGTYWDYQAPSKAFQNNDITLGLLRRDSVQYNKTRSAAGYLSGEYDASSLVQGLKLTGGIRYTHDTIHSVQNTYIAPIDAPLLVPTLTAVLESFGLSPADAAAGAAATTAPIPYGKCVTYGVGGLLTGAAGSPCLDLRNKFHAVTWTAGASYQFPSGQMIYAKISRGYRPGGVNSSAPQGLDPAYQPEYDRSIEAGLKGDWSLGGMSLRTNLAAYYDRYTNIQKDVVLIGAGGVASGIVANIAAAKVKGVEFEGTLVPVHGLTLGTIFAYTDAKYDRDDTLAGKTGDPCDPTQLQNIGFCSRNLFAYTPKYQLGLTADWTLPLDEDIGAISVGGQFNRVSKQSLSSASKLVPGAIEPAHSTLDLNARWRAPMGFEPVELSVFVTNVTDKLYRIGTNNLTQNSSLGTAADIYAPPRMFGVSVRYRFGAAGS